MTTTQWRKWAAAAAVFSALFLVYQIYSLINNFLMWMSSGTPRAQGDNLEGNPQCVHHVIGAKTVSFPALLVTLLVNVGVHFLLRTPSDEDLQRRVEQYKSENRDLRIQSQKTGGDRDIQKEVDAQIALTVQRYKIHYDTKERELEAEHIKEIDKLRAEIEGLKKPESPAEEVQMHDAQTNTDDWENTNTDWPQEARQAKAEIETLNVQIVQLKTRLKIGSNMGLHDAQKTGTQTEAQEETSDEKHKRQLAAACAGRGAEV